MCGDARYTTHWRSSKPSPWTRALHSNMGSHSINPSGVGERRRLLSLLSDCRLRRWDSQWPIHMKAANQQLANLPREFVDTGPGPEVPDRTMHVAREWHSGLVVRKPITATAIGMALDILADVLPCQQTRFATGMCQLLLVPESTAE
eukprot:1180362-Amphidinium_carterae.1